VEDAVAAFNDYLKTRSQFDEEERNQETQEGGSRPAARDECECQPSIDIGAVQEYAEFLAGSLAADWGKEARQKTLVDTLEEKGDHQEYVERFLRTRLGMET